MYVTIKATGQKIYVGQRENLEAALTAHGVSHSDVAIQLEPHEAADAAGDYIERHYPTYKQLNIMRLGAAEEVAKMGTFIDACRDWSNGDNPDPAALAAITP